MTKQEIYTVIELFLSWNGEDEPIDTANLPSAVDYIYDCMAGENVDCDCDGRGTALMNSINLLSES